MKMMIVILKDNHADPVTHALTSADFRVTRVASTSGFLRRGVVTLFSGMEDDLVDEAIGIIKSAIPDMDNSHESWATIFVAPLNNFQQI